MANRFQDTDVFGYAVPAADARAGSGDGVNANIYTGQFQDLVDYLTGKGFSDDANLQAFAAALTLPTTDGTAGQVLTTDGAGNVTFANAAGGGDLLAANNLSDVANTATALANLGGVDLTTAQTIAGTKTFTNQIIGSSATFSGGVSGQFFAVGAGAATGGGDVARLWLNGDRVYIVPSDIAGGLDFNKEFTYDPGGDAVWTAEGGFKTTGDLSVESTLASILGSGSATLQIGDSAAGTNDAIWNWTADYNLSATSTNSGSMSLQNQGAGFGTAGHVLTAHKHGGIAYLRLFENPNAFDAASGGIIYGERNLDTSGGNFLDLTNTGTGAQTSSAYMARTGFDGNRLYAGQNQAGAESFAVFGSGDMTIAGQMTSGAVIYPNTDGTAGQAIVTDGAGNLSFATIAGGGGGDLLAANNLSDVANTATALANLGGVALTGDQTIAGVKTFSSAPIVPTPTATTEAANKGYVDGLIIDEDSFVSDVDTQVPTQQSVRAWVTQRENVVLLEDIVRSGALWDHAANADASAYLNDALILLRNAGGGVLQMTRSARLDSQVNPGNIPSETPITIRGTGENGVANFVVNNATGGIVLDSNQRTPRIVVKDISFIPGVASVNNALTITLPVGGNQLDHNIVVQNVNIKDPDDSGVATNTHNRFVNPLVVRGFRPLLRDNFLYGGDNYTGTILDVSGSYKPHIFNNYFNGAANIGVNSVGTDEEGFFFVHNTIVEANTGLFFQRTSREPEGWIEKNHLNCREIGMSIDGMKYFTISSNLFFCGVDPNNNTYQDIVLLDAEDAFITDNWYHQEFQTDRDCVTLDPASSTNAASEVSNILIRHNRPTADARHELFVPSATDINRIHVVQLPETSLSPNVTFTGTRNNVASGADVLIETQGEGDTESGTYTPALQFTTTSSVTHTTQTGTWKRSGLSFQARIVIVADPTGSTGNADVTLPTISGYTLDDNLTVEWEEYSGMNLSANTVPSGRYKNATEFRLHELSNTQSQGLNGGSFTAAASFTLVINGTLTAA